MPKRQSTKELLAPQVVPEIQNTRPEVFILESLNKDDEKHRRFEGRILSDMLHLCGKNPKYYYFQTEKELPHLVGLFRESQYRYLHISSHASITEIGTTEGSLTYERFAQIFEGHLKLRRLFFSACEVGNSNFVNAVSSKNKGMHSIVAPAEAIQFDYAAALWSAFYISMFGANEKSMKRTDIEMRLKALRTLFPVDFFFAAYDAKNDIWKQGKVA